MPPIQRQANAWVFTFNRGENETDDEWNAAVSDLDTCMRQAVRAFVYQMERGEQGRLHLQGYLECNRTRRLAWLKTRMGNRPHFEVRRGTRDQAIIYATKENTRVDEPVRFGDINVGQGQRTDIEEGVALLREGGMRSIAENMPTLIVKFNKGFMALAGYQVLPRRALPEDKPSVWFLHGPTGSGKTRRAYALADNVENVYPKEPTNRWWDGYVNQSTIVIDDYTNYANNGLNTDYMLRLLDMYPMFLEVKGSTVSMSRLTSKIVITSNLTLEEVFPTHVEAMRRRIDYIEFIE